MIFPYNKKIECKMILWKINQCYLAMISLLYPLRYVFMITGGSYLFYWLFVRYPFLARKNNEKEPLFSNMAFRKVVIHMVISSFIISYGFALYLPSIFPEINEYIFLFFPLTSCSLPFVLILGSVVHAEAYRAYKLKEERKK